MSPLSKKEQGDRSRGAVSLRESPFGDSQMTVLAVAAAAEQDDGDDNEPDPAIVEELAETVGMHTKKVLLKEIVQRVVCLPSAVSLCQSGANVRAISRFSP